MVTEWLMSVFTSIVTTVLGWMPEIPTPDWLASAGSTIAAAGEYVEGTGAWIPWALVAAVTVAWAASMLVMVSIKGARIVASFLTLGGGSAA